MLYYDCYYVEVLYFNPLFTKCIYQFDRYIKKPLKPRITSRYI